MANSTSARVSEPPSPRFRAAAENIVDSLEAIATALQPKLNEWIPMEQVAHDLAAVIEQHAFGQFGPPRPAALYAAYAIVTTLDTLRQADRAEAVELVARQLEVATHTSGDKRLGAKAFRHWVISEYGLREAASVALKEKGRRADGKAIDNLAKLLADGFVVAACLKPLEATAFKLTWSAKQAGFPEAKLLAKDNAAEMAYMIRNIYSTDILDVMMVSAMVECFTTGIVAVIQAELNRHGLKMQDFK